MSSSCPACAEPVLSSHTFCPHCSEPLQSGAAERPQTHRSLGVSACAFMNLLAGGLGILACLALLALGIGFFGSSDKYAGAFGLACVVAGVSCLVAVVPCLALGIGLLKRRPWARVLTIVASVLWVGLCFLALLSVLLSRDVSDGGRILGSFGVCVGIACFVAQGVVLARAGGEFSG